MTDELRDDVDAQLDAALELARDVCRLYLDGHMVRTPAATRLYDDAVMLLARLSQGTPASGGLDD